MSTRDLAKRIIPILVCVIVLTILYVAKNYPMNGKLVCTYESAPGDPKAKYTYTASFKFWKVNTLESKVVITSKRKDVLKQLEEETKEAIKPYNTLSFYDAKVTVKDTKLTSITTINYSEIDYNKLAAVEGKAKVDKGSLSIQKVKKMYNTIGATCKYK